MTEEMTRYYARRAREYERVYTLPAWQAGIAEVRHRVVAAFAGRRVFEVACGTGYWTELIAAVARSIHATDLNEETLTLARARPFPRGNATFAVQDAYTRASTPAAWDAGFAGLWLSHVDLARMREFIDAFHSHLAPGAIVVAFDERDDPTRTVRGMRMDDATGNRYEARRLENGEHYEIVKNFVDAPRLHRALARHARNLQYDDLGRFWIATWEAT
ncbi:MAG TPA: class I SAM-dependent methyltransferase [Methylomirabilota bacterium]|jgi:demethylmenaquinone methyltransferase/2-methoxy-6-polyprenyl-1,4-benzoquinol methylase